MNTERFSGDNSSQTFCQAILSVSWTCNPTMVSTQLKEKKVTKFQFRYGDIAPLNPGRPNEPLLITQPRRALIKTRAETTPAPATEKVIKLTTTIQQAKARPKSRHKSAGPSPRRPPSSSASRARSSR